MLLMFRLSNCISGVYVYTHAALSLDTEVSLGNMQQSVQGIITYQHYETETRVLCPKGDTFVTILHGWPYIHEQIKSTKRI